MVRTSSPGSQRLPSTATLLASMTRTRKTLLLRTFGVLSGTFTVMDQRSSVPPCRATGAMGGRSGNSSGSKLPHQGSSNVRMISCKGSHSGRRGFGSGSPTIGRPKQPFSTGSSCVQLGSLKSSGASKILSMGHRIWYNKGAAMCKCPPHSKGYRICRAINNGTSAPATPVYRIVTGMGVMGKASVVMPQPASPSRCFVTTKK
mmetsp:Transcript_78554/g.159697  ORF Transcript_78554/g.159697 Transcript_78554/m.159697 type:complete len:203 (-) Transcript_78554:291-899(-)